VRNTLLLSLIAVTLASVVVAAPPKKLVDEIDPSQSLSMKWRKKIGYSTYRTNAVFYNGFIVVGSNGSSFSKTNDRLDGLYFLDALTGEVQTKAVEETSGDRDVNGVAVSTEKIFWGDDNRAFFAYNWDGKLLWVISVDGDVEGSPVLTDVNGDAALDVCFTTESGSIYMIDGKNGTIIWKHQADFQQIWATPRTRSYMASPVAVDANRDGTRDIIVGNRNGRVYAFNGKTGEVMWQFRVDTPSGIFSSIFVKNNTLYLAESYNVLYELNLKGEVKRRHELGKVDEAHLFSSPIVSNDGTIAIGSSSKEGRKGVWFLTEKSGRKFYPIGNVSASPVLADMDNDGDSEFVVLSESGWLYVFSSLGDLENRYSLPYGGEATPVIADVDHDGALELILMTSDQFISCYETNSTGEVVWGSFRGNPHNTGVLNDRIMSDLPTGLKQKIKPQSQQAGYVQDNAFSSDEKDFLVTDKGIGKAQIGMTYGKLKAVLGKRVGFRDVDLGIGMKAKGVFVKGIIQYYILYPSFKTLEPTDVISVLATNNPQYKTAEGIGPGTRIKDAEAIYGQATLTYQQTNSREELIHFRNKPQTLWFARYEKVKAGEYKTEKPFNMTQRYRDDAVIEFIGVKR
jgi:outer membrane protein assembly factor BamB